MPDSNERGRIRYSFDPKLFFASFNFENSSVWFPPEAAGAGPTRYWRQLDIYSKREHSFQHSRIKQFINIKYWSPTVPTAQCRTVGQTSIEKVTGQEKQLFPLNIDFMGEIFAWWIMDNFIILRLSGVSYTKTCEEFSIASFHSKLLV